MKKSEIISVLTEKFVELVVQRKAENEVSTAGIVQMTKKRDNLRNQLNLADLALANKHRELARLETRLSLSQGQLAAALDTSNRLSTELAELILRHAVCPTGEI
jgi:hypothetical protein